jgi:hypothetical protein
MNTTRKKILKWTVIGIFGFAAVYGLAVGVGVWWYHSAWYFHSIHPGYYGR